MSEHLYGCPFGDYIDLLQLLRMFEEEHKEGDEECADGKQAD